MTTLPLTPYWDRITEIYYNDIQDNDYVEYSIWDWLKDEYCCERVRIGFSEGVSGSINKTGVRFEHDSDITAFMLRFT
jgi:hypothetical protein